MLASKLDSAAVSWAGRVAKKKTSVLGVVIPLLGTIVWLLVSILTQNFAHAAVTAVWAFATVLQFERRGYALSMNSKTRETTENSSSSSSHP